MVSAFDRGASALASQHEEAMPNSVTFEAKQSTRAPGGATTVVWAPVPGRVFACRLSPLSVEEQLVAMQTQSKATWRLSVPRGTVIDSTWRAIVSGVTDDVAWTKTLAIVGVLGPRSIEAVRYLLCAEWTPGS